jgi:hypothetical protein
MSESGMVFSRLRNIIISSNIPLHLTFCLVIKSAFHTMASSSPVYRLFLSSSRLCNATAKPRRIPQSLRRTLHFSACDRQLASRSRISPQIKSNASSIQSARSWEARRQFSVSAVSRHGHLEPPKPGEECVTI